MSSPSIGITANNNNDAATEALIARLIAEDLDGDNAASAFSNDAPQQGKPSAMTWGGDDDENGKGGIYDDGNIVGEEVESTGRWDDAVAGEVVFLVVVAATGNGIILLLPLILLFSRSATLSSNSTTKKPISNVQLPPPLPPGMGIFQQ